MKTAALTRQERSGVAAQRGHEVAAALGEAAGGATSGRWGHRRHSQTRPAMDEFMQAHTADGSFIEPTEGNQ
jgi:hypothetical protein